MNQQVESIGRWVATHNRIELLFKQLQYSFNRSREVVQEAPRRIAWKQPHARSWRDHLVGVEFRRNRHRSLHGGRSKLRSNLAINI
jgi:hypothetical protein